MKIIDFPYGKGHTSYDFEGEELIGVLTSSIEEYKPSGSPEELIRRAMENPIDSPRLSDLAVGKKRVVIIASDHTRPVPSKFIIPPMLREIREGAPDADVTILIATGCHRGTTRDELIEKFGEDIVENEKIVIHNSADRDSLVSIGTLPSGGELLINRLAVECDLLVSEGFIEPHFFAGFSGGRKSVLPGVAARESVLANHCSEFIASDMARTGVLDGNPIHTDMIYAARKANLAYIVNVVLNEDKTPIFAVAGDALTAHRCGCDFLSKHCGVSPIYADVVISTNGGYPLDQNVYQSVKGMTAAEGTVKKGGVIIMLSSSSDGHGGEGFYNQLSSCETIESLMNEFLARKRDETVPDQWQTQILLRVLMRATVIFISDMPDEVIEKMHLTPAHSIGEAMDIARKILNKENPTITAIPNGISVMVVE